MTSIKSWTSSWFENNGLQCDLKLEALHPLGSNMISQAIDCCRPGRDLIFQVAQSIPCNLSQLLEEWQGQVESILLSRIHKLIRGLRSLHGLYMPDLCAWGIPVAVLVGQGLAPATLQEGPWQAIQGMLRSVPAESLDEASTGSVASSRNCRPTGD